eukprot:TRINITY_DN2028_c7_g1_i1.p1 TRINITY_DN2028_c7_g1~~TRINITY_DN2028_c7_g1_i1.p1  ORF type:complete len:268 (+),score=52.66 TRINITY_DN2028_c7_g1_i1:44-805(+)
MLGKKSKRVRRRDPRVLVDELLLPHDNVRSKIYKMICAVNYGKYNTDAYEYHQYASKGDGHVIYVMTSEHLLGLTNAHEASRVDELWHIAFGKTRCIEAPVGSTRIKIIEKELGGPSNFFKGKAHKIKLDECKHVDAFLIMLRRFHPEIPIYADIEEMTLRSVDVNQMRDLDRNMNTTAITLNEDHQAMEEIRAYDPWGGHPSGDDPIDEAGSPHPVTGPAKGMTNDPPKAPRAQGLQGREPAKCCDCNCVVM